MRKFNQLIYLTFITYSVLGFNTVFAEGTPVNTGGDRTPVNSGGGGESVKLLNPLGDKDLTKFLQEILNVIMIFAVPLIVFMIIYAGFLYVTAQGNEAKVTTANKALLYAVIGGVLILGAQALLTVICGTVESFGTTPMRCGS